MSVRRVYLENKGYIRKDGSIKYTKVTRFCLPMFGLHYDDFGNHLLNVYSLHEESPHIYIVVQNPYKEDYRLNDVLEKLRAHPNFVEEFKDDEDNEIVYKLILNPKHEDDYYKIISGDYSKISDDYKNVLTKVYSDHRYNVTKPPVIVDGQVLTTMHEVLYPSPEKRAIIAKHFGVEVSSVRELISKPDIRYELYKKTSELFNEEQAI